jgi:hypothetical protein
MGVQNTAVFSLLNNPSVTIQSVAYFLKILNDLGFIIKGVNGETSPSKYQEYEGIVKYYTGSEGLLHFRGSQAKTINFVFINMIQILNNETIEKAIKIAKESYKEQSIADKKLNSIEIENGGGS